MTEHETTGITVVGTGRALASPDVMTVDIGISVLALTVTEGRSYAEQQSTGLISALRERGVDSREMRTIRYSIHPEYDQRDGEQRLRGYRVTNEIRITIRDLATAGELIDVAAEAGGDDVTVNNVAFTLEDEAAVLAVAREAAWLNARVRGEHLAQLAGRNLGPVVSMVETSDAPAGPPPLARAMAMQSTPIEKGSAAVTVTLEVRFTLE